MSEERTKLNTPSGHNFEILITEDDGTTRTEWYGAHSEQDALDWATLGQLPYPQSAEIISSEEL